jgi:hypothetical protein
VVLLLRLDSTWLLAFKKNATEIGTGRREQERKRAPRPGCGKTMQIFEELTQLSSALCNYSSRNEKDLTFK